MTEAERRERENEIHQQENMQRLRGFRLIDDTFMRALMKDNMPLAEFILRIIMKKPDLKLIKFNTQDDMKQVTGSRSICLDVTGTDDAGKKYDIEVQRAGSGADRAKYLNLKESPEGVSAMCKAMDDLRIESERKGEIKGVVEMCQEFGKSVTDTIAMLIRKFNLSEDDSHGYVAQYWKV